MIDAQALTGANVYFNGLKMPGHLNKAELPSIEFATKEVSTSVGKKELVLPLLKPLTLKLTFSSLRLADYALIQASFTNMNLITIRANFSDDFEHTGLMVNAHGVVKKFDRPAIEMEGAADTVMELVAYDYSELIDNVPVVNYDVNQNICFISGRDLYADIKTNI